MNNLIASYFRHLSRYKLFYLAIVSAFVMTAINIVTSIEKIEIYAADGDILSLEEVQLGMFPVLPFIFGIVGCLFFGTEYSDGTIRNKLICGKSRLSVYASSFITFLFINLCITFALLAAGVFGLNDFGTWKMGTPVTVQYLVVMFMIVLAFTAMIQLMFMLCTNKAASSVAVLVFIGVLMVVSSTVYNRLSEPETIDGAYFVNGVIEMGEEMPNPYYIGGALRIAMQTFMVISPSAQAILTTNVEIENALLMCFADIAVSTVVFFAGAVVFSKKDIK